MQRGESVFCCAEACKIPSLGNLELRKAVDECGSELLVALVTGLAGTSGLPRVHKTASILCNLMEVMAPGAPRGNLAPVYYIRAPDLCFMHVSMRHAICKLTLS